MKIIIDYEACGGFDNRKPNFELVKELIDTIIDCLYIQVERSEIIYGIERTRTDYNISGEIEVRNYQKETDYIPKGILVKKFHKNELLERKEIAIDVTTM